MAEEGKTAKPSMPEKKLFSIWKIITPVVIGMAVVAFMFWKDTKKEDVAAVWHSLHLYNRPR